MGHGWSSRETFERPSTFDEVLRQAAADSRPIVVVAEPGIDVARVARALHELARSRGRFVEREWATLRDPDREIAEALAEATEGTLFLHGEGFPARLPAVARKARVRVILSVHPDARRRLDPAFRRAAQRPLVIPPLRERPADIPELAAAALRKASIQAGKVITAITPEAACRLCSHDWPGNEEELENVLIQAVSLEPTSQLTAGSLPPSLGGRAFPSQLRDRARLTYREFTLRTREQVAREYLVELLRTHHGSVTHAAIQAEIARESLHRLFRRYGLRPGDFRPAGRGRD